MAKQRKPRPAWRQLGFQLNENDVDDNQRIGILDWLAERRKRNTVLRKGLDIVYALQFLDDATPLLKYFPNVGEHIALQHDPLLQAIFNQQQEILVRLKDLEAKGIPTQSVTGKPLQAPKLAMPTFDDEDTIELSRENTSTIDAGANFLGAAFGLHSEPH